MKTDWIAGLLGPWSAELAPGSILLRLALSMALAAIIGCERSSKRHSAGLRTFILVSLAGTATMLIDQYLMELLPVTIPVLSAAAVIGITTISANSILFSSKNQIKGLTTSVGLWCCGIVGLGLDRPRPRHPHRRYRVESRVLEFRPQRVHRLLHRKQRGAQAV